MRQHHWLALGAVVLVGYLLLRRGGVGGLVSVGNSFAARTVGDAGYGAGRGSAGSIEPVLARTWANTAGVSQYADASSFPAFGQ